MSGQFIRERAQLEQEWCELQQLKNQHKRLEAEFLRVSRPLTRDEIMMLLSHTAGNHWCDEAHIQRFARAIESAHGVAKETA